MSGMEDEVRALIEQASQLEDLTRHPGWAVLEDFALRGPTGSMKKQEYLVNGHAKNLDEYRQLAGEIKGIQFVLDAPRLVERLALSARERADERVA